MEKIARSLERKTCVNPVMSLAVGVSSLVTRHLKSVLYKSGISMNSRFSL